MDPTRRPPALRWPRWASPRALLPVCFIASLFALFRLEMLRSKVPLSFPMLYTFGLLAVGLGALLGSWWELLFALSQRFSRRRRRLLWIALPLLLAGLEAHGLNVFGRLSGRYALKALGVLGALVVGNLLLALIVYGMHRDRAGFLYSGSRRARWISALLLCGLAVGLFWVDLYLYAGLYPEAHFGLKIGIWCLLSFGLALPLRGFSQRWPLPVMLVLIASGLVPSFKRPAGVTFEALLNRAWSGFAVQLARDVTDVDLDGYSSLFDGGDCQAWNHEVNPGAREIPGNGVDDNCFLGDAVGKAEEGGWPPPADGESPYDIVLITVDALRPDHLGVYNPVFGPSGRATSPQLDAFARQAVVFENAYSTGGATSIALPTMLRGVYARRLRWVAYYESDRYQLYRAGQKPPAGETLASMFPLAFGDPRPTLPELLQRRGMYTAAVLADGFSEMLTPGTGIERGFNVFQEGDRLSSPDDDKVVTSFAIDLLDTAPRDRKLFLWAHFFGTHAPNTPHPGAREYGGSLGDGYDHEINYWDKQFGDLMRVIDRWPRPIVVIVAADHGDVMRNGRYHGYTLHDDVMRIPLMIRVPSWPAARITTPASLIDVLPTVLSLTNTPAPRALDGLPLSALISGSRPARERMLIGDTWVYGAEKQRVEYSVAVNAECKVILDRLTQGVTLEPRAGAQCPPGTRTKLDRALRHYLEETGGAIDLDK